MSWRKGRASSTKKEKKAEVAHLHKKRDAAITPVENTMHVEVLQPDSFSGLTHHLNQFGERNVGDIMRKAVEQEHRPTKCRLTLSQG